MKTVGIGSIVHYTAAGGATLPAIVIAQSPENSARLIMSVFTARGTSVQTCGYDKSKAPGTWCFPPQEG